MTLLIASATTDIQLVVADRRITNSATGKIISGVFYKIIYYHNPGQNYQFGVAFTGLAEVQNVSTADWLMKALPKAMDLYTDPKFAITRLALECTTVFAKLSGIPSQYRGLTLVLCGWYNEYGALPYFKRVPFLAIVSNCIDEGGRQTNNVSLEFKAFSTRLLKPKSRITVCRGNLRAASRYKGHFRQLVRYLRRNISHQAKVRLAAEYIRLVANPSGTIGPDILGLALLNNGMAEGFDYHIDKNDLVKTMPHFVSATGATATNFMGAPITDS